MNKTLNADQLDRLTNAEATELALDYRRATVHLTSGKISAGTVQITIADNGPSIAYVPDPGFTGFKTVAAIGIRKAGRAFPVLHNVATVTFHND